MTEVSEEEDSHLDRVGMNPKPCAVKRERQIRLHVNREKIA